MKLSHNIPPIYVKCNEKFGVRWSNGVIITYGDTVYCKNNLTLNKIAHEECHVLQQTLMDKDVWWDKYFNDVAFRLSQEIEAYQAEAQWIKDNIKDRNKRFKLIYQIWHDLSSSMYGNFCTLVEAKTYIPFT